MVFNMQNPWQTKVFLTEFITKLVYPKKYKKVENKATDLNKIAFLSHLWHDKDKYMTNIATNKRARFDYEIKGNFEAGLVLTGNEVKSVKLGRASLKGAFVTVKGTELYLTNCFIPLYPQAHRDSASKHADTRPRKLLLKKSEIRSLIGKFRTEGLTLVPIRLYTKKQLVKLEFAVGKGKKAFDKRQTIKKRDSLREVRQTLGRK
jgi:SsrA-binding protein